ncbi:hypothetical protein V8E54_013125 [Elaphomyces granulatus]
MAEYFAESTEASVSGLMRTGIFPLRFPALSAPKPDLDYGYATGQSSDWSCEENTIADHEFARPYTQPARGNKFPFFVFELKSEATGGTWWHAENQAAGSGTCCVGGESVGGGSETN